MHGGWFLVLMAAILAFMVAIIVAGISEDVRLGAKCRAEGGAYLRRDNVCLGPNVIITPRDTR